MKKLALLLCLSSLGTGPCDAQLSNNKHVAKVFLDWDEAWRRTGPETKARLAWVPQAMRIRWRRNDFTYRGVEQRVNKTLDTLKGDTAAVALQYQRQALAKPSATDNYAWAYAELLRYQSGGDIRNTYALQQALSRTYTSDYCYIRLAFLLSSVDWVKTVEPIAQMLLQVNAEDRAVQKKFVLLLGNFPTAKGRQQGVEIINTLLSEQPRNSHYWWMLANLYDDWWIWNMHRSERNIPTADAKLSLTYAKRDAALAIKAYQRSIQYSPPDSEWRTKDGPSLMKRITDWQAKNP